MNESWWIWDGRLIDHFANMNALVGILSRLDHRRLMITGTMILLVRQSTIYKWTLARIQNSHHFNMPRLSLFLLYSWQLVLGSVACYHRLCHVDRGSPLVLFFWAFSHLPRSRITTEYAGKFHMEKYPELINVKARSLNKYNLYNISWRDMIQLY